LTTQEQQSVDLALVNIGHDTSLITVSDAHTAMEYYYFADTRSAFMELSTVVLSHLYFLKVLKKPEGYNSKDMDEKRTWDLSKLKVIRRSKKNVLIDALVKVVCALLSNM